MRILRLNSALLIVGLASGCATSSELHQARYQFDSGAPLQALATLEQAEVPNRNRLLLLLDRGAVAFSAGQYSRAQDALLEANDLIEQWDQILVGEQSASLVTSEWATRYRGESSEQLWIHSYLMMAFLLQGNAEAAAVEARRATKRLEEANSTLHSDWFTRALIALSFEAAGAYDSAEVEYRRLVNDESYDGSWNHVIQRHTRRLGRDPIDGLTQAFHTRPATSETLGIDEGELIVFLQSGHIAKKRPGDITLDIDLRIAFPFYADYPRSTPRYTVFSNGESVAADIIDTDLTDIATAALSARGKSVAAKQIARIATKKALVDVTRREDELAGALVQLFVFVTEQADTRSWETLPGWFGMIRVPLAEGQQDVSINVVHQGVTHNIDLGNVTIRPGKLHFATYRTGLPLPLSDDASPPRLDDDSNRPESAPTAVEIEREISTAAS